MRLNRIATDRFSVEVPSVGGTMANRRSFDCPRSSEPTLMCPNCNKPMVAFELEGVEIDQCLDCHGTWLDAGELETIIEIAGIEPGDVTAALNQKSTGRQQKRCCPRCRHKLELIDVGTDPVVELDRCPRGHGIWFDKGEMIQVVKSCTGGEAGALADVFGQMFTDNLESSTQGE